MTIGLAPAFGAAIYNFTKALETAVCRGGHGAAQGTPRRGRRGTERLIRSESRRFGRIRAAARPKTRANPPIGRMSGVRCLAIAVIGSRWRYNPGRGPRENKSSI